MKIAIFIILLLVAIYAGTFSIQPDSYLRYGWSFNASIGIKDIEIGRLGGKKSSICLQGKWMTPLLVNAIFMFLIVTQLPCLNAELLKGCSRRPVKEAMLPVY